MERLPLLRENCFQLCPRRHTYPDRELSYAFKRDLNSAVEMMVLGLPTARECRPAPVTGSGPQVVIGLLDLPMIIWILPPKENTFSVELLN